nr:FAD-dependent oxidoreductase [Mesorhizobium prunaredense]
MADDADVIIVGAGLAGLVAAAELAEAGKKTIVVDQEPEQSLGGIFLVDSLMARGAGRHVSRRLHLFRAAAPAGRRRGQWGRTLTRSIRRVPEPTPRRRSG